MSREQVTEFTKQLSSFIQNNSVSTPSNWIGTITNVSTDYMTCDVRIPGKGAMREVTAFGVPVVGTSAIILFMNNSYSQPVAICSSINVLDQEKVDIVKSQNAMNFHNNGDFSKGSTGYTGNFILDMAVTTGEVLFEIESKGIQLDNSKRNTSSSSNSNYILSLDVQDMDDDGVVQAIITLTDSKKNIMPNEEVNILIFSEEHTRFTDQNGQVIYNYRPDTPYTKHGYSVVLPPDGYYDKDSYIEFDCDITDEDATSEFFKVQAYYRSKESQLRIKTIDKDSKEALVNLPESVGTETQLWNADSNSWKVNREAYKKRKYETITVRMTNIGENPIRVDGILVHDESANYNFYNSKEDLING